MNINLANLINDYQDAVRQAVSLMNSSGIATPESDIAWACCHIKQYGMLKGGVRYFKHGYGCAVHLSLGVIDFDFGKNGEIDGFDASRLWSFAENHRMNYGFKDEAHFKDIFEQAAANSEIIYSGYILYYCAKK
jgi:hypothetical protein